MPASKTVLIADDTAFVRDRFAEALKGAGHQAVTVASGSELLARLRDASGRIDLVVMDLRLPGGSGLDLVKALRKTAGGKDVPILIFSGTIASAMEVKDLAGLGIMGYVNEYSSVTNILPALAPHLFPDNFNRRSSPRVVLGIHVSYRFGNTIAAALTLNISKGGIAIRTMNPLERGSRVKTRFRLPGGRSEIEAESRVAWTDRRLGMGLQFEKVSPSDQAAIDEYIDTHFFNNRKA